MLADILDRGEETLPFTQTSVQIHNGFASINLAKARCVCVQHLICGLGKKPPNVDIGDSFTILEAFRKSQLRRIGPHGGHSPRDRWVLLGQAFEVLEYVSSWGLHHLEGQTRRPNLGESVLTEAR